jgi:hypothetical protein
MFFVSNGRRSPKPRENNATQSGRGGYGQLIDRVPQPQKFSFSALKLFPGFQIFLSPQTLRPGRLRGPEIKAGAGRCPVPARTQLALWRIWL